ncbi:uncharacterized protein EI90DRAFT_3150636 [Cantharellus anzutake]|uniref:uncharacterized protein n=1 Tax=Cantharellus anzutake TaxID=1750568 RepID=UPI0019040583|nr:uncharacterized protein EI90DRAFT_3150636 [Cantharellus anzutake]KAF8341558.1 hypothetical protein EI90DRAFT_3150636 [Cantharellus anzutake]
MLSKLNQSASSPRRGLLACSRGPRDERRVSPYPLRNRVSQERLRFPRSVPNVPYDDLLQLPPNWDACLPQGSGLTRTELAYILSRFFQIKCSWHKAICPRLFLRDLRSALGSSERNILPQKDHASAMLYNVIIAYSLGYSPERDHRSLEYRKLFALEAKKHFDAECNAPTLATVQALAMLSAFHSGVAEQGLSFTYLGTAIRVSQTLCLDGGNFGRRSANREEIRFSFVFWNLYCLDKACSLYVGRRQCLKHSSFEAANCKASAFPEAGLDPRLFNLSGSVLPEDEAFVAHVGLMQIASLIMEVLYLDDGLCRTDIDVARVEQMSNVIDMWTTYLPQSLRGDIHDQENPPSVQVIMIKAIFEWISILLYQPFFQDSKAITFTSPSSSSLGVSGEAYNRISRLCCKAKLSAPPAAFKITALFEVFDHHYGLNLADNTVVQIVYAAGKIHLLNATHTPGYRYGDESPGQGVIRCIEILRKVGDTWSSGAASAKRLEELYRPIRGCQESAVEAVNPPSPPPPYS